MALFASSEILAGSAPLDGRSVAVEKRSRRKTLTRVDMRSPLGMRIKELRALFESAFSAGELTPIRRERIAAAAQLQALAEKERGRWMRGEARCNLDELIRAERSAASAVKGLGIVEAKPAREERGLSAIERLRAHMNGLIPE
jgi:hypothetical protein